jgi:transcriptional regulator with XRE-family HTH domain
MSPETLPVKLRQVRGAMDIAEAATRSGVPEERIREYENGERRPYRKTLKRLAEAYGIPFAELAAGYRPRAQAGSRPARPAATRRRRRRPHGQILPAATGNVSVQVPVEVTEDGAVRILIELVIRPAAGAMAISDVSTHVAEAVTTAPVHEAPAVRLERPGDTARAKPSRLGTGTRQDGTRGKLVPVPASRVGSTAAGPDGPRDPLADFRRAYSEFRRQKK